MDQAPAQTTPEATALQVPNGRNNKTLVIVGSAIVAAVLVVVGVAAWIFLLSPGARAQQASNDFMSAATQGDVDKLYELDDANDQATKQFLKQTSEAVRGDFSLKDKADKDDKYYFLYDLTNSTNKHARSIVENKAGEWVVSSFVFSKNEIALIPSKSAKNEVSSDISNTPPPSSSQPAVCLTDADVSDSLNTTGSDNTYEGYRVYPVDTYFFQADSTAYAYPDQQPKLIQKVADWYKVNSDKNFTIQLRGMTKEESNSSTGYQLATDRVKKIADELIAAGIPANRIKSSEPKYSAQFSDGTSRNVDIDLRTPLPCTNTKSSNGL